MQIAPRFLLALAAWLIFTGSGEAATEIPFSFQGGTICLKVDAGGGTTLGFLLDSGAGKSVLDLGTARRLGVKLGGRETVQGVDGRCAAYHVDALTATVGAVPVPRQMLAIDLQAVSAASGMHIDGLLGADFFREHVVEIDFRAQKLRLRNRGEAGLGQSLPLARRNDALCIRVGVNGGAPQWTRLDTGCSSALEWVTGSGIPQGGAGTSVAATSGSARFIETDVLLGTERVTAVKTGVHRQPMFAGEAGLVGTGLLSRFVVTVDAAGGRLWLARASR
jgi:hypothetical protein